MKQTSPKTSPTRQGITRMTRKRPPLAVFHVEPAGERWVRFPPASANPGAVFNAHAGLGPSPETSRGTQRRFRHSRVAPEVAPRGRRSPMTTQFYPHSLAALGLALFFSTIGPRA